VSIITDTKGAREQFNSSVDLWKLAPELYKAVLCTIKEQAIRLNEEHSTKKRLQKILRPAPTAAKLNEVLGSMDQKVDAYKRCLQSVLIESYALKNRFFDALDFE
jgi:hypothetical protein